MLFRLQVLRLLSVLAGLCLPAAAASAVASQEFNLTINPAWALYAPVAATLTHGQTAFQPFQSSIAVSYEVRTTPFGSGKITLQVTTDFSPRGGPSVANGVLTYTCGGASLGAPCSGTQTATLSVQTPVVTLPASACTGGGGACSGSDPNSVNVTFFLSDDPAYSTGMYSADITFIISAI